MAHMEGSHSKHELLLRKSGPGINVVQRFVMGLPAACCCSPMACQRNLVRELVREIYLVDVVAASLHCVWFDESSRLGL